MRLRAARRVLGLQGTDSGCHFRSSKHYFRYTFALRRARQALDRQLKAKISFRGRRQWPQAISYPAQPSPFCAICPALASTAICSRMQPQRWVRAMYTEVQPSRPQLCSPTHRIQGSLASQLICSYGHRAAEHAHVHQNEHRNGRSRDTALQLHRITDVAL